MAGVAGSAAARYACWCQGDLDPYSFNPLANDNDADGDALTLTAVGTPSAGTAAIRNNGVVYTITNAGFVGTDAFSYSISDSFGGTAAGNIEVVVQPIANWQYRKKITLSATLSPNATLASFPLLLSIIGDADLPLRAQTDGDDVDFDAATGDRLDYGCAGCPTFPITIATWFNARTLSGILFTYGTTNLTIAFTGTYLHVGPSSNMVGVPMAEFTTNTWYHVAAVYTAAASIKVYVNGVDRTGSSNDYWNASGNHFGSRGTNNCCGSPLHFNGTLDEARLLRTTLSAEAIDVSYRNQSNPSAYVTVGAQE